MKRKKDDTKKKVLLCVNAALEKKAKDITILNMQKVTSFTDYAIICSGNSDRQVQSIAQAIEELCFLEHFHLTWDVGHDARSGFREREVMMRHEDRVRHMHLHDYNGRSDHQVPGTGLIDIPAMLDFARRKDIRVLVEVKDERSLRKSVRAVRSLL